MFSKLKMHSQNKVTANIKSIAALFPNCVTERKNADGEVEYAIDFDILRQELSDVVVEGKEERYQFTWPDKKKSILAANAPISDTLRPCREESVDFDNTQNLYIEGDNLAVLKLLQETYLGKIKMIYIDPPYNTGNDFVYNDDFAESAEEYFAHSGQFDEEGNRLVANTESNGRFHTDWLNMIYPRLKLAKDLLTDDGVIFISIDDNEVENLRKLCHEIFGNENFVGELIIQTATDNNPRQISTEHEYMLCYAKNILAQSAWVRRNDNAQKIQRQYEKLKAKNRSVEQLQIELRKWIKDNKDSLSQVTHYDNVDEKGVYHDGDIANTKMGGYKYDVIHPITKKPCKIPEKGFRFAKSTMLEMIENGDILFGEDETVLIKPKKRLEDAKELLRSVIYEDGRAATKMVDALLSRGVFDHPKSISILLRIIDFVTQKDSIILDFFSGSATTAHAVMQLNVEDGGNRKFIMVQLPEETDEKSEAYKAGYKNICEIGKERIRRAGAKIKEENGMMAQNLDTGFRVLKLDSSNMKDVYYNPDEYEPSMFESLTDNIKADRTPEDLLFQVMLDLGVLLSSKIEETTVCGKKVFNVADGYLYACFDSNVSEETITEIAKKKPYYFVMRDSSMASDSVATNFEQIFATYSPETERRVL